MNAAVDTLQPDAARLWANLMELATLVETDSPGWTREVFSDVYSESRQWTMRKLADAGLEVHVDGGGNIIGRLPGEVPGNLPIVTGSHTDTTVGWHPDPMASRAFLDLAVLPGPGS